MDTLSRGLVWFGVLPAFAMLAGAVAAQERFLARGGQADATIVIGQDGGPFCRWAAGERVQP